ncbi:hypothetical protein CYLTODRAFT_442871 [Cylindrobasidium torrendii FP15055 ss-10]|uniref:Uncharacterized protein n=1 Tax=Cylindrobasidium torrendii FP15055 ss-10 TaxID=1314674 RepID=A0A0D7BGG3_9AGAR|nr:hypothetical protein CYLTODRAFT_442871 [Cylindrobasidium torrendii FP15055 ss-10]
MHLTMSNFTTRLTRALDDFIDIQLSADDARAEAFTSQWQDLLGDWQAAKDAGLTDEETDFQVYDTADAIENLCERLLDVSLADDARFDEYSNEGDGLVADAGFTAWLSMHDISADDLQPKHLQELKHAFEQIPHDERVAQFERYISEHDVPPDSPYDETREFAYTPRFLRGSSPADGSSTSSSRASSIFSSCSPASSQSSLPSRPSSPCFSRSASPTHPDYSQSNHASSSYNPDQLAALRMFGFGLDSQRPSAPYGLVNTHNIMSPTHTERTFVAGSDRAECQSPRPSLFSWTCDLESGDSPSPFDSPAQRIPPHAIQGPLSPSLTLFSDVDAPNEAQEQGSTATPCEVGLKRRRQVDDDDCQRPSKHQCRAPPARPLCALPRRRAPAARRPAPTLPRPSSLLSSAVRWLVEHPGILFPSESTASSIGLATGRSAFEAMFAFKDIRRQMKVGGIPRFFLRAEDVNKWCAGYWHMRRLKDEKGWSRLNRDEKQFCIDFEEQGRVGQTGQGEVIVDEPSRSYVIAHLNRIRKDIESAYKCMMGPDANLSTMGHLVKNRVAVVSGEACTRVEQEERDGAKTVEAKGKNEELISRRELSITRSFNDWAAHFLHTNRNRKHPREPAAQDEPPLKRARIHPTKLPPAETPSFQQPAVLPAQFLQNIAPETITSWFDSTGLGHSRPGTAIDPIFGVTNMNFTDSSRSRFMDVQHELAAERAKRIADPTLEPKLGSPEWFKFESVMLYGRWWKSEGISAPRTLELSVANYDWSPEIWDVGGFSKAQDDATLTGLTCDTNDKPTNIDSAVLPDYLQSIVDDGTDSLSTLLSFDSTFPPAQEDTLLDLDHLFSNGHEHSHDSTVLAEDSLFGAEAAYVASDSQQDASEDWFDFGTNDWSTPINNEHPLLDDALLSNISLFGPEWDFCVL